MPLAIVADFPLGAYHGHVGEGEQDMWPSPARLHAAFLAAAGQGTSAVEVDGSLSPSRAALEALSWLESHPPDGIALPLNHTNRASNTAYRDIGALRPRMTGTKKLPKRDNESVALGAPVVWVWESNPPAAVVEALDDLCPDVPYLGQADSPVRLRVATTPAMAVTHRRDTEARLSTARRTDLDMTAPGPGRTSALVAAHRAGLLAAAPRPASDRARQDEYDRRSPVVPVGVRRERYVPVLIPDAGPVPWEALWVLPIVDDPRRPDGIRVADRVRWCVALHRALIAIHGDGAPAVLTGRFAQGVPRPANRVAIQIVDRDPVMNDPFTSRQAFVVAVPAGADPGDVEAVAASVAVIRTVRAGGGGELRVDGSLGRRDRLVDASRFWAPPPDGMVRCWTTATPVVSDTRPPRGGAWSLADAVGLSVALAWRDTVMTGEIAREGYDRRLRALVVATGEFGVEVLDVRRVTERQDRYVHRVTEGFLVQPYVAVLHLGDLAPVGQMFAAIGQSRHLGGGLLTPTDVLAEVLEEWRQR